MNNYVHLLYIFTQHVKTVLRDALMHTLAVLLFECYQLNQSGHMQLLAGILTPARNFHQQNCCSLSIYFSSSLSNIIVQQFYNNLNTHFFFLHAVIDLGAQNSMHKSNGYCTNKTLIAEMDIGVFFGHSNSASINIYILL